MARYQLRITFETDESPESDAFYEMTGGAFVQIEDPEGVDTRNARMYVDVIDPEAGE